MADIFLSYAREDRARAAQVAQGLEAAGLDVFWDNEIPPGQTWADYIEGKLTQCKALIVLWSQNSTSSQWVREEARMGRDKGVLIPVMIEQVQAPFGFGEVQAADLSDWNGEAEHLGWRRFVSAVTAIAQSPARPAPTPPQPQPRAAASWTPPAAEPEKKKGVPVWVWIAGVAAVAVLGVAIVGSMPSTPGGSAVNTPPANNPAPAAAAVAPPTTDGSPQAIILAQLQQAHGALSQQGYQLIGQPATGGLAQGQTWNVPAELHAGYEYRFVGVCDRDCADMDLVLFDPTGQPIIQDRSTNSQPVIGLQPPQTGGYTLQVQMYNCSVAPCYWAVALYGAAPR